MYRHASLRLPCVACGVEQAVARMELSPRGGHWCWRCQVGAQIVEHRRPPRLSMLRELRGVMLAIVAILGGLSALALLLLSLFVAYAGYC